LREKGACAYPGRAHFFPVPPIISGTCKATKFKFGTYIHSVHVNKSRLRIWEKRERGRIQGFPIFYNTPYYLRNAYSYQVQIWQVYSQGPSKQKLFKNLGEKGAGEYSGTAQIFPVPPIISGTRRATKFKFGRYIHSVYPTKRLLKIWEKRESGCIQGLSKFFPVHPIVSGTRKATNFKFGRYIHSVYPTKRLLKIWEKRQRWRIQGLPNFFKMPLLFQERVKVRTSNFSSIFRRSMQTNVL